MARPRRTSPVIDLLRRYSHVDEHDDTRTIQAKVTGQVVTLDPALQDTVPALLALLDALPEDSPFVQLDPPQRRQRTLDALKRLVIRESQVQPLLLVCEDLHWIDSETQASSIPWSRVSPPPTCCCWSTIDPNTSTPGAARRTTPNCGWTRCRPPALTRSCRRCWGTIPAWRRSSPC